jgi:hypothetical protein
MKPRLGGRASWLTAWTLWGTGLVLVPTGCSSSSSGTSIATACAEVAETRCNEASECSLGDDDPGIGFGILASYGDRATCVARQTLNCTNALNAPDNGNNPTQIGQCVAALVGYSCALYFDNQPPAACTPTGPRASGAPCTFNGQCMSGTCNGTKTSVCGTCGAAPAADDDCSDSTCVNGDRCVSATTECQIPLASGGVCDSGHPCDRGLSCIGQNDKTGATGICQTASTQVGAACGGTTLPGCDATRGLYCGGSTGAKTCMRIIYPGYNGTVGTDAGATESDAATPDGGVASPTPAGTLCGLFADGTRSGCVAGECYTATGVATGSDFGTCKPFSPDNGVCDTSVGPGCMFPARCVVAGDGGTAGSCVVPVATMCPSS